MGAQFQFNRRMRPHVYPASVPSIGSIRYAATRANIEELGTGVGSF
jgi:hypothetical protein